MFRKAKYQSPNFNDRIGVEHPSMIILHYTGMISAKDALERLCDPAAEVSAHYVIDEKGKTHQLVADDKRAWHAGKSYWSGIEDINSLSIGIELVNPGHEFGYTEFPNAQILSLIKLCKALIKKYKISAQYILAHSDVAPDRKLDPGHLFPWERLAGAGIGLWPAPNDMDYQAAQDLLINKDALHELLCGYGYDPASTLESVLVAYHRHFYPILFKGCSDYPDQPDAKTCAGLLSLIRQSHEHEVG